MSLVCPVCNSRDIDFSEASGHSACMACGTVVEENTIVSSIEFQESGDRSSVVGQFVSATCSKQYASEGGGRYGNTRESRDATLAQARRVISQVASSLHLPPLYVDRAYRLYQIALERNFVFGRRQMHVVATCLYTICRQEKSPHLLIDFSDALQVNVFVLGSAFLKFSRLLNMPLPTVDPSLYIHRFAARLEMGDKMNSVITTALRIVTRLKKDWISTGRRPDGVCAAAMLIATRAHGFHKAQGEIAKLFRVSADTLKNRLLDFKATPSAQLTVEQFHSNDSTEEYDPPSYIKNLVESLINDTDETGFSDCEDEDQEISEIMTSDSENEENNQIIKKKKIIKPNKELVLTFSNSNKNDDDNNNAVDESEEIIRNTQNTTIGNVSVSVPVPGLLQKKTLSSTKNKNMEAMKTLYGSMYSEIVEKEEEDNLNDTHTNYNNSKSLKEKDENLSAIRVEAAINAAQGNEKAIRELILEKKRKLKQLSLSNKKDIGVEGDIKIVQINTRKISKKSKTPTMKAKMVAFESSSTSKSGSSTSSSNNQNKNNDDNINDTITIEKETEEIVSSILEDKDVDVYILTEEEQKKRTVIWEKTFRVFLDEREKKRSAKALDTGGTDKVRKKSQKNSGPKLSASQAVYDGASKKTSKKINYEILQSAFGEDGTFLAPSLSNTNALHAAGLLPEEFCTPSIGITSGLYDKKYNPLTSPSSSSFINSSSGSKINASIFGVKPVLAANKKKINLGAHKEPMIKPKIAIIVPALNTSSSSHANTTNNKDKDKEKHKDNKTIEDQEDQEDQEDYLVYEEEGYDYEEGYE